MESRKILIGGALAAAALVGGYALISPTGESAREAKPVSETQAGAMTQEQVARLGIKTAQAKAADGVPLGSVPAIVSLPPENRVAVTAALPGAIRQLFVIEGQAVTRGQALATMVSRDAMELGGSRNRAGARIELARASLRRAETLFREGVVAGSRVEEARAQLRQAESEAGEASRNLASAGAGADGMVTLRAPISGRVSKVSVQTGGPVDGMTAPFVIDATNSYQLDLQLPERLASSVRPGMPITLPGNIGGTILSVGSAIDPDTRSVPAKASVGAAPGLIAGKSVMVSIGGATQGGAVSVPSAAVTIFENKSVVFVRTAKGFEPREIVIGGNGNGETAILSGLKMGESVATSSIPELKMMHGGEE